MSDTDPSLPAIALLLFDKQNRLYCPCDEDFELQPSVLATDLESAQTQAQSLVEAVGQAHELTKVTVEGQMCAVYVSSVSNGSSTTNFISIDQLSTANTSARLKAMLSSIEPHLVRIPYLDLGENEYIYRFRTAKERNRGVYVDQQSEALYQSALCTAIKAVRRTKEKKSGVPAVLDFGPVRYVIPSHFGFCLGVQNAIERAYEAVATNPGKRVFMLSELIHNPFVNEDLLARGLRYLQTDKGLPLRADGTPASDADDPDALWNQLTGEDIVIIPAFGATNEDKARLIRRGIAIRENDATCMLVEKVWKAARRYASEGFTVLIHGKSEHEETKATFSNSAAHGPALMIRNMDHAEALAKVIEAEGTEKKRLFEASFEGLCSDGFDAERDLEKIAVVNQTTLLRNETLRIIDYLREVIGSKYGEDQIEAHLWSKGKGDTLCYATQVNQDALHKAVEESIDAALVVGGRNSSNTYQLYRVCKERFGEDAHYIQSESNILSKDEIRHYHFPVHGEKIVQSESEVRPFLKESDSALTILLTGGASCPDGIIQQVINKINSFFPAQTLRSIDEIVQAFESEV